MVVLWHVELLTKHQYLNLRHSSVIVSSVFYADCEEVCNISKDFSDSTQCSGTVLSVTLQSGGKIKLVM